MLGQTLFGLDLAFWYPWLLAGAVVGGLAVVLRLSRTAFAGRPVPPESAAQESSADPAIDPFLSGSANERRASLRRRGRYVRVLVSNAEANITPLEGLILDRSTGGLCLSVPQELAVGKVISIRPAEAPVTIPWTQAEVRYCRKDSEGWETGCAFVRTPPWSVLLHFG